MLPSRSAVARSAVLFALLLGATALLVNGPAPRGARADHLDVVSVRGHAFGHSGSTSLFGGAPQQHPRQPLVELPSAGGGPTTATAPSGSVRHGPAVFFTSGAIEVSARGTLGPAGSVTSHTDVLSINTSGQEPFTASRAVSACTATDAGPTGSTTIEGGTLRTSDPDPDTSGEPGEEVLAIPVNPPPNTSYSGQLSNGDQFRYVFNEQVVNPDDSLVVRTAHLYLLGPAAVGDVIIGESLCGVTTVAQTTTTTFPDTTTSSSTTTTFPNTTTSSSTTTTFPNTTTSSSTTTTFPNTTTSSSTTTTVPPTTTTTIPPTTTTTIPPTTTTTTPLPRADVSVEKSAPATVRHNDAMIFRMIVRNAGPDTARDVLLTDFLPYGTRYTAVTTSQGTCTAPHRDVSRVVCELGDLSNGGTAAVELTVRVLAPHSQGHLNNVVQVSNSVPDPDHEDNEDVTITSVSR